MAKISTAEYRSEPLDIDLTSREGVQCYTIEYCMSQEEAKETESEAEVVDRKLLIEGKKGRGEIDLKPA